jgi:hypothetical protein
VLSGILLDESGKGADYQRVLAALSHDRVDALVVSDDPENFTNRSIIVELAETDVVFAEKLVVSLHLLSCKGSNEAAGHHLIGGVAGG